MKITEKNHSWFFKVFSGKLFVTLVERLCLKAYQRWNQPFANVLKECTRAYCCQYSSCITCILLFRTYSQEKDSFHFLWLLLEKYFAVLHGVAKKGCPKGKLETLKKLKKWKPHFMVFEYFILFILIFII